MVEAARGEPGTLVYEWFVSDDGSAVHVYERYADSAAVVVHGASFVENFVERFLEAVEPTRFTVYGSPDAAARETLSALAPAYLGPFDGFAR
jgi:quinol monooxygenase YgiN